MDFFDNEIIRAEAAELMETFQEIQSLLMSQKFRSQEGGLRYLQLMERLLELQEMIFFRAKYSKEEDAKEYIEVLNKTLPFVSKEGETDPSQVFRRMKQELADMKKFVE
jgi:hypothetical protein